MTMQTALLLRGVVLGFSIAAPVGPIGILCVQRTLANGRLAGFVSGLGAATADTFYSCVAAFGLASVSSFLNHQQVAVRLVGGGLLCYLGLRALLARPPKVHTGATKNSLVHAYVSTMLLTLANPVTVFSFASLFSGLGAAGSTASYASAASLAAGVFVGSISWWITLAVLVGTLHHRTSERLLKWTNRAAGVTMLGFAALVVARAL